MSGNVKLALSHVVPDLVLKVLRGQDPLHILGAGDQIRCYTYGGDLAHGIRLAMESGAAINEDFNLSTPTSTTVMELAQEIWRKLNGDDRPFRFVSDPRSSTTSSIACRTSARPGTCSASTPPRPCRDARRGDPMARAQDADGAL